MTKYHVGCSPENNVIYAGTINKTGDKWTNKTDVTEECLEAVTNHFLRIAQKEETNELGYRWQYEDGTTVFLKIVVETKENEEEKDENT